MTREPRRVVCRCGCGAWWYSPPAHGGRKYLDWLHRYRAVWLRISPSRGEARSCQVCGAPWTALSRRGRPTQYCSSACRVIAKLRRDRRARVARRIEGMRPAPPREKWGTWFTKR